MSGSSYLAPLCSVLLLMMTLAGPGAKAFPDGAPVQRCQDMTPNHRDNTPKPNEASPFVLTTSKANYSAGEIITVTIRSTPPTMFRGLLLQARDSSSKIVGTFINPSSGVKPLACNGIDNTAVTHTSRTDKPEVSVSWKAPMAGVGDVTFRATVVQNFATFYVGLSSAPVRYMAMDNNMKNNNMNNNNDNNMNNDMDDMTKDDMGGMNEDDMMHGGGDSTGVSVTSTVVVLSVTLLLSRLL